MLLAKESLSTGWAARLCSQRGCLAAVLRLRCRAGSVLSCELLLRKVVY